MCEELWWQTISSLQNISLCIINSLPLGIYIFFWLLLISSDRNSTWTSFIIKRFNRRILRVSCILEGRIEHSNFRTWNYQAGPQEQLVGRTQAEWGFTVLPWLLSALSFIFRTLTRGSPTQLQPKKNPKKGPWLVWIRSSVYPCIIQMCKGRCDNDIIWNSPPKGVSNIKREKCIHQKFLMFILYLSFFFFLTQTRTETLLIIKNAKYP